MAGYFDSEYFDADYFDTGDAPMSTTFATGGSDQTTSEADLEDYPPKEFNLDYRRTRPH